MNELSKTFSAGEKPPVGIVCEALWDSCASSYMQVRILAYDEKTIIFRWLEGPRKKEIDEEKFLNGFSDAYNQPTFRPIQTKAEEAVKEPETVPKWKFDCIVKELEFYQNKLNEAHHLENKIKMFVDKDVWFWENDGENHLESLVCPIVIDADVLRSLIKNGG